MKFWSCFNRLFFVGMVCLQCSVTPALVWLYDIFVIISEQESGEWNGYDQSDKAQKCPPYRERKEDDGRIHAHGFADDFRGKDEVLYGLHYDIYRHRFPKEWPEVHIAAHRTHYADECGWDE